MAKWIYDKWDLQWDFDAMGLRGLTTSILIGNYAEIDINDFSTISADIKENGLYIRTNSVNAWETGVNNTVYRIAEVSGESVRMNNATGYGKTLPPPRKKGTLIESVTAEEGTYPDDGIHTDGYWYVKVKKAFPAMRILRDGQWVEVDTGYVLKDGVWKQIEEIYKLQDGQWVQA